MTDLTARPSMLISRALPDPVIEAARARADVLVHTGDRPLTKTELVDRLQGRQGLVCQITDTVDAEVLAAARDLRVVANVAVGYNNVDVAAATRRGVLVTNTPDVLTETTADFAWALLMATARRVVEADRYVRDGRFTQWEYMVFLGGDVHGKTLGVIGLGRIGRAVARRAAGFDMRVLYCDAAVPAPPAGLAAAPTDLATLLRESDFVTVHTPLLPETRHLIDAAALRSMKRTAYLVNASRGPVVDEAALAHALADGWIAGAGLDVYENEPAVHPGLIGLPNVVLAPHIGSGSHDTRIRMAMLAVDNCLAVLEGRTPPSPVNPEALRTR